MMMPYMVSEAKVEGMSIGRLPFLEDCREETCQEEDDKSVARN